MFGLLRNWRRERARKKPFPKSWREVLSKNVPLYRRLPPALRATVEGHVQVLLAEKRFEGCGGLELTDEIRVTIAGHAALLLLGRARDFYPRLSSILVYPSAYRANTSRSGTGRDGDRERRGEARGILVARRARLAWDEVLSDALGPHDGHNVALHEFAHQLDQEDRAANGTPFLGGRGLYAAWSRVLGAEYERLRHGDRAPCSILTGRPTRPSSSRSRPRASSRSRASSRPGIRSSTTSSARTTASISPATRSGSSMLRSPTHEREGQRPEDVRGLR